MVIKIVSTASINFFHQFDWKSFNAMLEMNFGVMFWVTCKNNHNSRTMKSCASELINFFDLLVNFKSCWKCKMSYLSRKLHNKRKHLKWWFSLSIFQSQFVFWHFYTKSHFKLSHIKYMDFTALTQRWHRFSFKNRARWLETWVTVARAYYHNTRFVIPSRKKSRCHRKNKPESPEKLDSSDFAGQNVTWKRGGGK